MQQGRSPPRAVLALGLSGLVAVALLYDSAPGRARGLPDGLSRDVRLDRLAAVAADGTLVAETADGRGVHRGVQIVQADPRNGAPPIVIAPGAAPLDPAIAAAIARIQALAETFARLARDAADEGERARRDALADGYATVAAALERRAAAGEVGFADLPPGIEAVLDGGAVVVSRSLAGRQPGRPPTADEEPLRLTQVLLDLPFDGAPSARGQWARQHDARLAGVDASVRQDLRPYLTRYWFLQDAYLVLVLREAAPALAALSRPLDLTARAVETAFQDLLAEVRTSASAAADGLVADWSAYRTQVAELSAAAAAGGPLTLERLFAPVAAPGPPSGAPEISVAERRLADLQSELSSLGAALAAGDRETAQLGERLLALQAEVQSLAQRDEGQQAAVEALAARLESGQQALARMQAAAAAGRDQTARRLARLRGELGSVVGALDTSARDLGGLRTEVDALRESQSEIDARTEELAQGNAALSGAVTELRAATETRAETLARLEAQVAGVAALDDALGAAQTRLQSLESAAQTAEAQRQALGADLGGLARGLAAQEAQAEALRSEIAAVAGRVDDVAARVGEAVPPAALASLQAALDGLAGRVAGNGEALGTIGQRLTALDQSLAQVEPRLQAQRAEFESLSNAVGEQTDRLSTMERELAQGLARVDELDARVTGKADGDEVAAQLAAARQAAERAASRVETEAERIAELERRTSVFAATSGDLDQRIAALEGNGSADVGELRLRVEAADARADQAQRVGRWALIVAAISAVAALLLAARLLRRGRAAGQLPAVAAPPAPATGEVMPPAPDQSLAAHAEKADAQKRRLEALDVLLAKLAFAIHADRERAGSVKRDLAALQRAVRTQAAEAANSAAELERLQGEAAILAEQRDDLKSRTSAASDELAKLEATRRKLRELEARIDTLRRGVRVACDRLIATLESAEAVAPETPAPETPAPETPPPETPTPTPTPKTRAAALKLDVATRAAGEAARRPSEGAPDETATPSPAGSAMTGEGPAGAEPEDRQRGRAIAAIKRADLKAFVRDFARLTGLPQSRIGLMLFTGDGHDLAAACRANGIGKAHFAALFIIARRGGSESREALADDLARAIRHFHAMTPAEARAQLSIWQDTAEGDRPTARADG